MRDCRKYSTPLLAARHARMRGAERYGTPSMVASAETIDGARSAPKPHHTSASPVEAECSVILSCDGLSSGDEVKYGAGRGTDAPPLNVLLLFEITEKESEAVP